MTAAVALALAPAASAQSFSVSPTSVSLDLRRTGATEVVFEAPHSVPLALDLSIVERSAESVGGRPPTDAPLRIVPTQLLVPAGKRATTRIEWIGAAPTSRSFYLVAEQAPVDFSGATEASAPENVRLLTRVRVPVHVFAGGAPAVTASRVEGVAGPGIELFNHGTRYVRVRHLALRGRHDDGRADLTLSGEVLLGLLRTDALLPGARATVPLVALPADWRTADVEAELVEPEARP